MSNAFHSRQWLDAHLSLNTALDYETTTNTSLVPADRKSAFQHLSTLYVKYVQTLRKLEDSYDQLLHPQKRRLLREVLVAALSRVVELRHKLVEVSMSEVFDLNDILMDLKLTPDHLKMPLPRFIIEERGNEVNERQEQLKTLGAKELGTGDVINVFPDFSVQDAVRIIQTHERGRQGRLRAKYMRDIKLQAEREKDIDAMDDDSEIISAVTKIQRIGYKDRKIAKARLAEELAFLSMRSNVKDSKQESLAVGKSEANRVRRKNLQKQFEEEYQAALINTKDKIHKVEGPDIREAIQDSFRQWYMDYKRLNGKFPEFPADNVWQHPEFQFSTYVEGNVPGGEESKEAADASQAKGKAEKGKAEKGAKGGSAKKGAKGKGEEQDEEKTNYLFNETWTIGAIKSKCDEYGSKWLSKDESENFSQKHDQEIVKMEKRKEVEAEIKLDVFEILKEELKNLKLAVDRDKNSKSRKGKKGKKGKSAKGKKGKKGKGKKDKKGGKKGKKEKDLTGNRTMESIIEELVETGILQQKYPKVSINDIKGDINYRNKTTDENAPAIPTIVDLERVLTEYCILPLGCPPATALPRIKSILLFGPRGTGKTLLVNAIASQAGAYLFNVTPKNTAGQFIGKPNVTKMVHMVFKVAKAFPPAIIYIDNVEMIFAKKVPKDDTSDPKRLKKDLLKQLKSLTGEDRVFLIGTSFKPWDGDAKALTPIFDKILYCPKPDYSSRYVLWREFILDKASFGHMKDLNLSLLARMSNGLSSGTIKLVCERVLTERRLKLMRSRKLDTNEFIEQLLTLPPPVAGEEQLFLDWYSKTPLERKRLAALSGGDDEEAGGDKKKKGAAAKGGKKK